MIRLTTAVAAVLAAILLSSTASARTTATPVLKGTVGPGFTISLKKNGAKVTKLKAGTYTFVIDDKSTMHSYALDGPKGFAKDFTSVPFKGSKTFTVALKKGSYKYYCAAHEAEMFGHFTVS